jgi:tRNA (guanine-N7-)-methyltransferase
MMADDRMPLLPLRTYARREGRITHAQRRALDTLLPRYGVTAAGAPLDLVEVFGRRGPVVLEIGFGNGEALCALAEASPDSNFIGVEIYRPGIGHLLLQLAERHISNVRVIVGDARLALVRDIAESSLTAVHLFFPDPWPKRRHHKRRLVQPDFLDLVRRRLQPGGRMHVATDWQDYAEHVRQAAAQVKGLARVSGAERGATVTAARPSTRFERRGRRLGHRIWDLVYERVA